MAELPPFDNTNAKVSRGLFCTPSSRATTVVSTLKTLKSHRAGCMLQLYLWMERGYVQSWWTTL